MTHTFHDAMRRAIAGQGNRRIPWVPRMDLWYRANRLADTLPPGFKHAELVDILDG